MTNLLQRTDFSPSLWRASALTERSKGEFCKSKKIFEILLAFFGSHPYK